MEEAKVRIVTQFCKHELHNLVQNCVKPIWKQFFGTVSRYVSVREPFKLLMTPSINFIEFQSRTCPTKNVE